MGVLPRVAVLLANLEHSSAPRNRRVSLVGTLPRMAVLLSNLGQGCIKLAAMVSPMLRMTVLLSSLRQEGGTATRTKRLGSRWWGTAWE